MNDDELSLRLVEDRDLATVAEWLSVPDVNRWLSSAWRGRQVGAREVAIAAHNRRNKLYVGVQAGELVGLGGLFDCDPVDLSAMLWAFQRPGLAGKGLGTRLNRMLLDVAFDDVGLEHIWIRVMEHNVPSLRVAEKIGFRAVGTLHHSALQDGRRVNEVVLECLPGDRKPIPPQHR